MDINQVDSLILSEWAQFYIDYKKILKILGNSNINKQEEDKKEIQNINNILEEKLLENNEQNEEEKKRIDKNNKDCNNLFKKYIDQLILEKNKICFFDNILQNKRHNKRFEEIIEQLKYIEKNETIKIFKRQLIESLKNLYREISNYDIYYLKVNINIMADIIEPVEGKFIDENELMNDHENIQNLKKVKNEIKIFFENAREFNTKFLSQIKEYYIYYIMNDREEKNDNEDEDILDNNLPNQNRLIKARFKLKVFRISLIIMLILLFACCFIYFFYLNLDIDHDPEFRSIFPMYRTFGIICLYLWFIGLNIKIWEDIKVNYKALFSFQISRSSIIDIWICCTL